MKQIFEVMKSFKVRGLQRVLMALLLLVAGAGQTWAAEYRVIFDHELPGAGYTLGYPARTSIRTWGNPARVDSTTVITSGTYTITSDNVTNYIRPKTVAGYTGEVWINSGGEICVGYTPTNTSSVITWHDDVFEYSTLFVKSSTSTKLMPSGEVAIRLYCGGEESVTDTVAYTGSSSAYPQNKKGDRLGETTNYVYYAQDDDGDDANGSYTGSGYQYNNGFRQGTYTSSAKYKCLGNLDYEANVSTISGMTPRYTYFYERTHTVKVANGEAQRKVTVPLEVTAPAEVGGGTYKVTAIQKWGFCYNKSAQTSLDYCKGFQANQSNDNAYTSTYVVHNCINDHSNEYLESVDFGDNSNITEIGDYAFISCDKLTEITLPWRLTYLGVGTFEFCKGIQKATLQTCPLTDNKYFGQTRLNIIQAWTFIGCFSLEQVYLADGVKKIEGLSYGAPFQYLSSLNYIRLPNTLEYIGPHFLCTCTGLTTVTIPASVEYIDGACFHGCESLNDVLLLGKAADLQALSGESRTFSENATNCGNHVNTATFWVVDQYQSEYENHSVWGTLLTDGYNNTIKPFPAVPREFKAGKWASVVFPPRVADPNRTENPTGKSIDPEKAFGEGTMVAVLSAAKRDDNNISLYHLTFTQVEGEIPTGATYMLKPGQDTTYEMYNGADQAQEGFTLDMTNEHPRSVVAPEDNAVVYQKGTYVKTKLKTYDFIFSATGEGTTASPYKYTFRKVTTGTAYARACGCWWEVVRSGVSLNSDAKGILSVNGVETGLDEVPFEDSSVRFVIDGIYDLSGRLIKIKQEELPTGMYIINGKKVLVK